MPDQRISVRHRVLAIDHLERVALDLNEVASWLGEAGCQTEADAVNDAAKSLLASCWWLSRPLSYALSPVAAGCRWSLLLLSPLLSAGLTSSDLSVVCGKEWAWIPS